MDQLRHRRGAADRHLLPLTINDGDDGKSTSTGHADLALEAGRVRRRTKRRQRQQEQQKEFWITCIVLCLAIVGCGVSIVEYVRYSTDMTVQTSKPKIDVKIASNGNFSSKLHVRNAQELEHELRQQQNEQKELNSIIDQQNELLRNANIIQSKTILCSDGITTGYLNDDYCDCTTDGRDEPTTSACSHLLIQQSAFICESASPDHEVITIYPSRIRDGIKDCLDGSDEV